MIQEQFMMSWRFWIFWVLAFLGFPIGGLLANLMVGPVTDTPKAFLAGLITGAILGLAQWLVFRSAFQLNLWWVVATSIGLAVGLAISTAFLGSETNGNELLFRAAITGLCIGIAQWIIFRNILPMAVIWMIAMTLSWTIGWFITRNAGVDLSPKWTVFGASGAITFQFITGITLYLLTRVK